MSEAKDEFSVLTREQILSRLEEFNPAFAPTGILIAAIEDATTPEAEGKALDEARVWLRKVT